MNESELLLVFLGWLFGILCGGGAVIVMLVNRLDSESLSDSVPSLLRRQNRKRKEV
jgi:hypothetical protein